MTTTISGASDLIDRMAVWTTPSWAYAELPTLVLVIGYAEEDHGPNAAPQQRLGGRPARPLGGVIVLPGHGRDRHRCAAALAHEHRLDELGDVQPVLAHEAAHCGSAA